MMWKAPAFWHAQRDPLHRILCAALTPVSRLYALAVRQRFDMHHPVPLARPVVCVGNLVAGGAGKTPVVMELTALLQKGGFNPHILTRGYGGAEEGPLQVSPGRDTAMDVGDEALLLVEAAPTWVSRKRALGAQAAIESGANIIVMDDGFQNPSFYKDVALLVVDGASGLGNGRVMPAGPLREDLAPALARADAVILMGEDKRNLRAELARHADLPVFEAALVPAPGQREKVEGRTVYAFAGIGRPEKFRETLTEAGAAVEGWAEFPDHFPYEEDDLRELMAAAAEKNIPVFTTAKDYVRLPLVYRDRVGVFAVTLALKEPEALLGFVVDALRRKGSI